MSLYLDRELVKEIYLKVLIQALRDFKVKKHSIAARVWLEGEQCKGICSFFDIEYGRIEKFLKTKHKEYEKHRSWTDEDIKKLLDMVNDNVDIDEIAKTLNRSKQGLRNKYFRIKEVKMKCSNSQC